MTVTLASCKSTMGLQPQCTCWENTVVPQLLQSFSAPTASCTFGSTPATPLQLDALLPTGNLGILVSLM